MFHRIILLQLALAVHLAGCTRAVVTKNPGYDDEGVRYFRPKPYLMIAPVAATKGEDLSKVVQHVSISIQYLPDYNEEYSIKLKPGLGVGKLEVELENGWNLTSVGIETDQKTAEIIGSIASLASATVPKFTTMSEGTHNQPAFSCDTSRPVPLGLYEAVIATNPRDCSRRIFGWRYIGFAPFNSCGVCPIDGCEALPCNELWGLTTDANGRLVFKPIWEIGQISTHASTM